jgi:apolipoprotein N-acyltransferase
MAAKYKNSLIWAKFGFQVDYDVVNWYSSLVCYGARNWMKFFRNFVWHKKREKFKVLGIGWTLIEMLYGMCIHGFEAWKFQMQKKLVIHDYINKQILDNYLHTKSEKIWLLFTFVLNWVFLWFPWQRQASKPQNH